MSRPSVATNDKATTTLMPTRIEMGKPNTASAAIASSPTPTSTASNISSPADPSRNSRNWLTPRSSPFR
ncbi:MAG: hypothetical protein R3B90_12085 [Planctomycetaceae bacterium]